jgi:hypothetical protein
MREKITPLSEFSKKEKDAAIDSARYILEEVSIYDLSKISGLPEGVIHEAFRNIFEGGLMETRTEKPKRVK